ncbi:nucleotidyltransferase family protein [Paenibacillus sp. CAA11]|uniref:nucleotidyltransferase family protein n=1 Tax=Paenibacillus sp. CAA11 TaxID=1532905 RepID=UPI000D34F5FB|nr:nucleotidyltransferase family protein [Paenibacillus sp. CAA11]AWB46471.1 nucleotidyltransferase family protein [Paenibacillus sp. CAA11]
MKALILAAGYATRLYPLTLNQPKALLPVHQGKAVLDYIIDRLEEVDGITGIVLVTNHKYYGAFVDWADRRQMGKDLKIIDDGTQSVDDKLGAIGDIQYVLEQEQLQLQDDLLVMAADNLFTFGLSGFIEYFYKMNRDCILVKVTEDEQELQSIGVAELDEKSRVISFEEKPAVPKSNLGVYALYLYKKETLPLFRTYLAEGHSADSPSRFPEWLYRRQEVMAYRAEGEIYDIGTPEAYEEIQRLFASGQLPHSK